MKKKLLISIGVIAFIVIAVFNFSITAKSSNESTLLSNITFIQSAQAEDVNIQHGCALVSTANCAYVYDGVGFVWVQGIPYN